LDVFRMAGFNLMQNRCNNKSWQHYTTISSGR
jgi:hypothetical protein